MTATASRFVYSRQHQATRCRSAARGCVCRYGPCVELTTDELIWISNALAAVGGGPYAVPEWEFSSLIGGSPDEVRDLLARVHGEVSIRRTVENQS